MASEGFRRCGVDSFGRLVAMQSKRATALKALPRFAAIMRLIDLRSDQYGYAEGRLKLLRQNSLRPMTRYLLETEII